MTIFVIAMIFCLCIIIFCICMIISCIKIIKAKRRGKKINKEKIRNNNASYMAILKHFYGLPIADGIMTRCFWCNDKVIFEANGASFNLPFSKITDVSIKTDVEIQKQYVSSAGGAVAGAVLFGPLGAAIGGRAKEKTNRQITTYLIFTYLDNQELKYIALESSYLPNAQKFVNAFQKIKPATAKSFDL